MSFSIVDYLQGRNEMHRFARHSKFFEFLLSICPREIFFGTAPSCFQYNLSITTVGSDVDFRCGNIAIDVLVLVVVQLNVFHSNFKIVIFRTRAVPADFRFIVMSIDVWFDQMRSSLFVLIYGGHC